MGIPPGEGSYEEADDDGACKLLLFDGRTPKYIEAHIAGINLCPIATCADPNGTYILTQADPIRWNFTDVNRTIVLLLDGIDSNFGVVGHPGLQTVFVGLGLVCVDEFVNSWVDCNFPKYGKDGTVKCFWGPGISP